MLLMRGIFAAVAATLFTIVGVLGAAPANADRQNCLSMPVLGLDPPQARTICDTAIEADGSWMRIREFWYIQGTDEQGPVIDSDIYTVTPDAIPAGEPAHLG